MNKEACLLRCVTVEVLFFFFFTAKLCKVVYGYGLVLFSSVSSKGAPCSKANFIHESLECEAFHSTRRLC